MPMFNHACPIQLSRYRRSDKKIKKATNNAKNQNRKNDFLPRGTCLWYKCNGPEFISHVLPFQSDGKRRDNFGALVFSFLERRGEERRGKRDED